MSTRGYSHFQIYIRLHYQTFQQAVQVTLVNCTCCGNMRHLPPVIPVIYSGGHHRGPAGCAGLGCKCRTVPLWSGSPPVQSQRGGETKNQSCCLKNDTWDTAVLETSQITNTRPATQLSDLCTSVLHCFLCFQPSPQVTRGQ